MTHHTHEPVCPLCTEKALTAHPYLSSWFGRLKSRYPNAHISWGWRSPAEQEAMFHKGRHLVGDAWVIVDHRQVVTNAHFGQSAHNKLRDNKPCALALDLFILDDDGSSRFPPLWYAKVNAENLANKEPIIWGGQFKSIGDGDHFELKASPSQEVSC